MENRETQSLRIGEARTPSLGIANTETDSLGMDGTEIHSRGMNMTWIANKKTHSLWLGNTKLHWLGMAYSLLMDSTETHSLEEKMLSLPLRFSLNQPLGRFNLVVAISMVLYACMSPPSKICFEASHWTTQVTWSLPRPLIGLSSLTLLYSYQSSHPYHYYQSYQSYHSCYSNRQLFSPPSTGWLRWIIIYLLYISA